MGWTRGKPRKPGVRKLMREIYKECERQGLYPHRYATQFRQKYIPRRYTFMIHDQEERPAFARRCRGPGCIWFGDRANRNESRQVQALTRLLESLKTPGDHTVHVEVLNELERRNKR